MKFWSVCSSHQLLGFQSCWFYFSKRTVCLIEMYTEEKKWHKMCWKKKRKWDLIYLLLIFFRMPWLERHTHPHTCLDGIRYFLKHYCTWIWALYALAAFLASPYRLWYLKPAFDNLFLKIPGVSGLWISRGRGQLLESLRLVHLKEVMW